MKQVNMARVLGHLQLGNTLPSMIWVSVLLTSQVAEHQAMLWVSLQIGPAPHFDLSDGLSVFIPALKAVVR